MNLLPTAGQIVLTPQNYANQASQEVRIERPYFVKHVLSDGLHDQIERLDLWFEPVVGAEELDRLQSSCLITDEFSILTSVGQMFGQLRLIELVPLTNGGHVCRLEFNLIKQRQPGVSLMGRIKQFFTRW